MKSVIGNRLQGKSCGRVILINDNIIHIDQNSEHGFSHVDGFSGQVRTYGGRAGTHFDPQVMTNSLQGMINRITSDVEMVK
jgi:hypothetical protein